MIFRKPKPKPLLSITREYELRQPNGSVFKKAFSENACRFYLESLASGSVVVAKDQKTNAACSLHVSSTREIVHVEFDGRRARLAGMEEAKWFAL